MSHYGKKNNSEERYQLEDLLLLMARLRDPKTGCPWDCQQDFASLVSYTLEEAYEVVDAIERGDDQHLKEELGDLLFQVVFYAQLGSEKKAFDFNDIIQGISSKLIARHPHVFPSGTLASQRSAKGVIDQNLIRQAWETKKQQERLDKGKQGILADIPLALPALVRAEKVQKRASKVGFDWASAADVLPKVAEECEELQAAIKDKNAEQIEDELGDVFFTLVNLSRHLGCQPEKALRRATQKFERRFQHMETSCEQQKTTLEAQSTEQLEALWQQAKI